MNERTEGLLEGLGIAAYFVMNSKSQPKRLLNELADMTLRVQLLVAENRIDIVRVETDSLLPSKH